MFLCGFFVQITGETTDSFPNTSSSGKKTNLQRYKQGYVIHVCWKIKRCPWEWWRVFILIIYSVLAMTFYLKARSQFLFVLGVFELLYDDYPLGLLCILALQPFVCRSFLSDYFKQMGLYILRMSRATTKNIRSASQISSRLRNAISIFPVCRKPPYPGSRYQIMCIGTWTCVDIDSMIYSFTSVIDPIFPSSCQSHSQNNCKISNCTGEGHVWLAFPLRNIKIHPRDYKAMK